jgi:hypothetical protein
MDEDAREMRNWKEMRETSKKDITWEIRREM